MPDAFPSARNRCSLPIRYGTASWEQRGGLAVRRALLKEEAVMSHLRSLRSEGRFPARDRGGLRRPAYFVEGGGLRRCRCLVQSELTHFLLSLCDRMFMLHRKYNRSQMASDGDGPFPGCDPQAVGSVQPDAIAVPSTLDVWSHVVNVSDFTSQSAFIRCRYAIGRAWLCFANRS
jgi:hypothetical protein